MYEGNHDFALEEAAPSLSADFFYFFLVLRIMLLQSIIYSSLREDDYFSLLASINKLLQLKQLLQYLQQILQ